MKRHALLVPLSREHHTALSLANRLKKVAASGSHELVTAARASTVDFFHRELEAHFAAEESGLLPVLTASAEQALVERTLADHAALRDAVRRLEAASGDDAAPALVRFAELLIEHVRFEERELFEHIQAR